VTFGIEFHRGKQRTFFDVQCLVENLVRERAAALDRREAADHDFLSAQDY
jgi:hypothetical protein